MTIPDPYQQHPYGQQQPYGQQYPYGQQPFPGPYGPAPDKQIVWVVIAFVMFLPVGIFALLESNKIDECWRRGDVAGAQQASENTKKIGQWTLYIALGLYGLSCVLACLIPTLLGVGSVCGLGAIGAAFSGSS